MKNHKLKGDSYIPQKELKEALKINFPGVFSDGKVDCEKLKLNLGEDYQLAEERYGLSWTGKSNCFKEIQTGTTATLKPNREESVDFDKTGNVFIEGDNLEALKVLQRSYYGKVKCIYIDPPYNTGHDFIYNDNFRKTRKEELKNSGEIDENGNLTRADGLSTNRKDSNGHFHSDWLNMMYPRLFLARNLLKQDGVIFVSIDDHEVHNLKMIMNEIFGEENFAGQFIVNSTPNARDYGHIGKMHEHILFYVKNSMETETFLLTEEEKKFKYQDEKGGFNIHPLYNSNVAFTPENRPNLYYPFYLYTNKKIDKNFFEIGFEKKNNSVEIYPPKSLKDNIQFVWRWGKNKSLLNLNEEIVGYKTSEGEYRVVQKMRHSSKLIRSLLLDRSFTSRRGTAELEELFGKKIYSFPKPVSLIKKLLEISTKDKDIILDFFAGSGTTAQAVMEQNSKDGDNRKWICVQLPELCDEKSEAFKAGYKNIAEIAKERIRRAGKNIKKDIRIIDSPTTSFNSKPPQPKEKISKDILNKLDIGFKSFKLDKSNFKIWQGKFKDEKNLLSTLEEFVDNLEKGSTKENIFYELILKSGLELDVSIKKEKSEDEEYFNLENGKMFIYLGENISIKMAEKFIEMKPEKIVCLERAFKNNNELKTNILIQAEQEDVDFKVV